MRALYPQTFSHTSATALTVAMVMVLLVPGLSVGANGDEIPHENYNLVGSNLDVVIALLNSSITYSEFALDSMYRQEMPEVRANLTVVTGVISPAEQILEKMKDVASSYDNLSFLVPPFAELSSQENSFSSMESQLLEAKGEIVSASVIENLTGDDLVAAWDAIARVYSLITNMNRTIDEMLVSATKIVSLQVEGERPFSQNNLIPLIERLRDLLNVTLAEVNRIIYEDIDWAEGEPFLLLWLSANDYYLGESIIGGGYLFFDGTFASNHLVKILSDGENLTQAYTDFRGSYSFTYLIPINSTWLGQHTIQSSAETTNGTLYSASIAIRILLIPTSIRLEGDPLLLALPEHTQMDVTLQDSRSLPIPDAPCHILVDGTSIPFSTDSVGGFNRTWEASDLGYGTHSFQAFFEGVLPYAESASNIVTVVVDIPTVVSVSLFSERFFIRQTIVGNGTLSANGSEPLEAQHITIFVDGMTVVNATTDARGVFAFAVPASSLAVGTHTLKAAFLNRSNVWRYSEDEAKFSVFKQKLGDYPFLPTIPGWQGGIPETIPYLFFGEYAYLTWLLVLALLGLTIRILQMRKHKRLRAEATAQALRPLEEIAAVPEVPEGASLELTSEAAFEGPPPRTPNEKIIWYYHNLLLFLTRRRKIGLKESMTHWEVARILRALGYPFKHVDRATLLFEKAMYSGTDMSESDTIEMSSSFGHLVAKKTVEVSDAV